MKSLLARPFCRKSIIFPSLRNTLIIHQMIELKPYYKSAGIHIKHFVLFNAFRIPIGPFLSLQSSTPSALHQSQQSSDLIVSTHHFCCYLARDVAEKRQKNRALGMQMIIIPQFVLLSSMTRATNKKCRKCFATENSNVCFFSFHESNNRCTKAMNNGFLFWIESSPFFDIRYFICAQRFIGRLCCSMVQFYGIFGARRSVCDCNRNRFYRSAKIT